ncbi:16S rRNA (guanine1516-N2)-methyltransferase [Allopseudospirillum japonicum]|uniref:Ribosomal RNA small subunit methyltransferase J n=1 Tax=Allopseudospirillum japonicum TaxID=64971 RepID=A0A1H6RM98_9GAMM|nr:class I SAM-dependent methyltransferase [Allopseudospirillum japonicum]SEI54464.1 16S rRNA (guanine1516-N2)-methyltransferase [Allopseudospirillum japonicum]
MSISIHIHPQACTLALSYVPLLQENYPCFVHEAATATPCMACGAQMQLHVQAEGLFLYWQAQPRWAGVKADFLQGQVAHRQAFGGGKSQAIAKAVGIAQGIQPCIVDATAGLGRDSAVFAGLGCQVLMLERHPVVHALLGYGLQQAQHQLAAQAFVHQMQCQRVNAGDDLATKIQAWAWPAEVIYLDPMFPHRDKSAAVKKEMQLFQHLVGPDIDADALLEPALDLAEYRVVVKRPRHAPCLAARTPEMQLKGQSCRFDIYIKRSLKYKAR